MAKVTKQQYTGIVKLYQSLIGSHQLWELWQDSITMFALAISNTVDFRYYKQREDMYMQLDLGSHWHGQFFTPYHLCSAMARMELGLEAYTTETVKHVSVCDCACGGGALLIAAAHEYRKAIAHTGLNAQNYICLYAQDLSQISAMMCYVQLSLLGFAGKIKLGDSLLHPLTDDDDGSDIWYTPMWFNDIWVYRRMMQRMDKIMIGGKTCEDRRYFLGGCNCKVIGNIYDNPELLGGDTDA